MDGQLENNAPLLSTFGGPRLKKVLQETSRLFLTMDTNVPEAGDHGHSGLVMHGNDDIHGHAVNEKTARDALETAFKE